MKYELPWTVTNTAVRQYGRIRDLREAAAARELEERLLESIRFKRTLDSGCKLWRFAAKPRLYLVVDPKTQKLVAVRPEHERREQ